MTIFVDMDEVLADTYQAHIDLYNCEFNAKLSRDDCKGKEVWLCVPEDHQQTVKDHTNRIGFFRDLPLIEHCQEVMRELCGRYEVYIASAAMQFPNSLKEKSDWLDRYFPFIHWRYRILCGDKHILNGDVLIDDRSYNLKNFSGRALLFTSPHNTAETGFERVDTWPQIAEKLL